MGIIVKRAFLLGLFLFFLVATCSQAQGILSVLEGVSSPERPQAKDLLLKKSGVSTSRINKKKVLKGLSEAHPILEEKPPLPAPPSPPLSPFEKRFVKRAAEFGISLKQIGYEFFRKTSPLPPTISVGRDYILGPGDELFLYVVGAPPGFELDQISRLVVDREGRLYFPGLGVFYVWGKSVAEAEKLVSQKLGANIRLTLGRLRTFAVYVSGEVFHPGPVLVTGVETPLEALVKAGGIKKTGSLRRILLRRRNQGKDLEIDFYRLILEGRPVKVFLRDGDVIFVPPIGQLAAIGGEVRRPGIYEFLPGERVEDLLRLAGGVLPSGARRGVILERYVPGEELKLQEFDLEAPDFKKLPLCDGDLIIVRPLFPRPENFLRLEGYTPYSGLYEYRPGLTLKGFLKRRFFFPDTSLSVALLERHPPGQPARYLNFSPQEVFTGKFDLPLAPGDVIRLFPAEFKKAIRLAGWVKETRTPYRSGLTLSEALAGKHFLLPLEALKAEVYREALPYKEKRNEEQENQEEPSKKWFQKKEEKQNLSHISTRSEFQRVKSVYLLELLKRQDPKKDIPLLPGDLVLIRKIGPEESAEHVSLAGYVERPGVYPLREGMRLYDLLKAAGGFKPRAYPEGIVILRASVAALQRAHLAQALSQMRKNLEKEEAGILQAELEPAEKEARQAAFEARRRLLALMEKTEVTGRIAGLHVPRKLELLKDSPDNILLEPGDKIYVPGKPANVLLFGEVHNPVALIYQKGLTVKDYIRRAGGFTKYADLGEIFVIRANGEALSGEGKVEGFIWDNKNKRFVKGRYGNILAYEPQPGEAIVVPTKIKVPTMWRPLIRDVIQIIYQSALTVYTITNL